MLPTSANATLAQRSLAPLPCQAVLFKVSSEAGGSSPLSPTRVVEADVTYAGGTRGSGELITCVCARNEQRVVSLSRRSSLLTTVFRILQICVEKMVEGVN